MKRDLLRAAAFPEAARARYQGAFEPDPLLQYTIGLRLPKD